MLGAVSLPDEAVYPHGGWIHKDAIYCGRCSLDHPSPVVQDEHVILDLQSTHLSDGTPHPNLLIISTTVHCSQKFMLIYQGITSSGTHSSIHTCLHTGIYIHSLHVSPKHGSLNRDICTQPLPTTHSPTHTFLPIDIFTYNPINTLYTPNHKALKI